MKWIYLASILIPINLISFQLRIMMNQKEY